MWQSLLLLSLIHPVMAEQHDEECPGDFHTHTIGDGPIKNVSELARIAELAGEDKDGKLHVMGPLILQKDKAPFEFKKDYIYDVSLILDSAIFRWGKDKLTLKYGPHKMDFEINKETKEAIKAGMDFKISETETKQKTAMAGKFEAKLKHVRQQKDKEDCYTPGYCYKQVVEMVNNQMTFKNEYGYHHDCPGKKEVFNEYRTYDQSLQVTFSQKGQTLGSFRSKQTQVESKKKIKDLSLCK